MKKNYLHDALLAIGDTLERDFIGIDLDHRKTIAGWCFKVSDLLTDQVANDLPEGEERQLLVLRQFVAREMLGAIYCAQLTAPPEGIPAEQQENLAAFVTMLGAALFEPMGAAASRAFDGEPRATAEAIT